MIRALLAALTLQATWPVHPLHTTRTELEERNRGEITIEVRAFSDDLRAAVEARERVVTDSALARYVRAVLELRGGDGRAATLRWSGTGLDGDVTLIRLDARLPGGLAGAQIRQTMHTEMFSDQVNVVQARYGGRRVSLLFVDGDGPRRLP